MYVKNEEFDLIIDIGTRPSEIGRGALYYQNALFAGVDNKGKYWPIGHVIKDGQYYQQYYKEMPWSQFIIPYEGRPYVGRTEGLNYRLAFYGTPRVKKDGVVFVNYLEEKTAHDILRAAKRSAIGVLEDGTIRLYTTQDPISLQELARRMEDCVDILNLDGGGSVSPTTAWERPTSSAIVIRKGVYDMKHFESYSRVSSPYGTRKSPITGQEEFHTGIDLVKVHRGEIFCTVPGRVVHAKFAEKGTGLGGFGDTVCVVDKNNHLHLYGHLDSHSITCKVGDEVKKGDVLGLQGNTGQSAGSHLHYEVRTKTTPYFGWKFHTDPIAYLDKYWTENAPKDWKEEGLEFLIKEYGISSQWKPTDIVDMGTLGTILRRMK